MKHFFLVTLLFLYSCKNLNAQKTEEHNLKSYFESLLFKEDSTLKLKKFNFVKVDTITLKKQYIDLYKQMEKALKFNISYVDSLKFLIKSDKEVGRTMDYLSKELSKPYKDEVKFNTLEIKKIILFDSLLVIDRRRIEKLINKADNIKPLFYSAKCLYTIKRQDEPEINHFYQFILDLNFNIVGSEQYSDIMSKLYKTKSDFIY